MSEADTSLEQEDLSQQILIESLTFLYRSIASAALGHTVTAGFIVFALHDVIEPQLLYIWFGCVLVTALTRLALTTYAQGLLGTAEAHVVQRWATFLGVLAFVQTSIWGASVFIIWPEDIGHRAVLVAILAGIIAAGGVMLALHRRSFLIYCLPITIPAVIQLVLSGSQLERILAFLLVFYSGLMFVTVNRLTNVFLEGLRLRLMMQNESRTDALTGLANRRGFDETFHDIWQQSIRSSQPVGLLLIDIDHFKNYNDYYGHPQGDVALSEFGDLLLKIASRSTDLCARIGGEEFAVLLPATELEGSMQVATAIQEELTKSDIPHRNSERGYLTVSIGLNVTRPDQNASLKDYFAMTDKALYEAKDAGRNAIRMASALDHAQVAGS